ncbi:MAG TPA: PP0621 family protein [Burkholderiaceae bacterium]|nr:PP0621 family protein [Burkholderiaceae bacterium]
MEKLFSWVVLIVVGLVIARILSRQNAARQHMATHARQAPRRGAPPVAAPEAMVRCAHCGIHLPRSEAVLIQGKTWCCEEHAKLGLRQ